MNDLATLALTELAAKAAVDHPTMTRSELERIVLEELVTRKQAELHADAKAMKAAQLALEKQTADDAKRAAEAARSAELEAARVAAEERAAAVEVQARRDALIASHGAAMAAHRDAVHAMANTATAWLASYATLDATAAKIEQTRVDAYQVAGVEGLASSGWHDAAIALTDALRAARAEGCHGVWLRALRDLEVAIGRA